MAGTFVSSSCFIFLMFMVITSTTGLLSDRETLLNLTTCNPDNIVIDCGADLIAIEVVELYYKAGVCTGDYDPVNDCKHDPSGADRQAARRECSGRTTCTLNLLGTIDFCTYGNNLITYVHVQYYCISSSRVTSLDCSTKTLTSTSGDPLYLTNPNYPIKTLAPQTCTCTIEVQDCSSQITLTTIDQDFYQGATCEQSVTFDDSGSTLKTLACEIFYESSTTSETLSSNVVNATYISTSSNDGYFFIGLSATSSTATMTLTCQAQSETWCIDCGAVPSLTDGSYSTTGGSSYGSTRDVNCDAGYDANTAQISCMEQGVWGTAVCTIKDCGALPSLTDGSYTLTSGTTYGSTANVNCNTGYDGSTPVVSCSAQGVWGTASCTIKDCGTLPSIQNGTLQLVDAGVTTYGALANLTCDSGLTATTNQITCLASGSWEAASCQDDSGGSDGDGNGDDNDGDGNGGDKFPGWAIALIVIVVAAIVTVIVTVIVLKKKGKLNCRNNNAVGVANNGEANNQPPDNDEKKHIPNNVNPDVENGHIQNNLNPDVENGHFPNNTPRDRLPPIDQVRANGFPGNQPLPDIQRQT